MDAATAAAVVSIMVKRRTKINVKKKRVSTRYTHMQEKKRKIFVLSFGKIRSVEFLLF